MHQAMSMKGLFLFFLRLVLADGARSSSDSKRKGLGVGISGGWVGDTVFRLETAWEGDPLLRDTLCTDVCVCTVIRNNRTM